MHMIASYEFERSALDGVSWLVCCLCYNCTCGAGNVLIVYFLEGQMQSVIGKTQVLPTCVECVGRFECGVGNANLCKGFVRDMGVLMPPCATCERRSTCYTWKECVECGRKENIKSVSQSAEAPNLKKYALRLAEFLPFEAEWAAVDSQAIRLFLGEPLYKRGKWCPCASGREICSVNYGDGMLNGVVDLTEFLEYEGGPIGFSMTKITL